MRGFVRRYWVELVWACFGAANFVVMILWPSWRVIPFHIVWISLTLLYGFRVWTVRTTVIVLVLVMAATALAYGVDDMRDVKLWGELYPLMAAMFLAMVWHARRRVEAQRLAEAQAAQNRSLFECQERFIHDASHELRTPVTIARGHLELLRQRTGSGELEVALDELGRIDAIIEHLLLLATADHPDFVSTTEVELEPLLEDVFMRWSEVAPRAWRLGALAPGRLTCDAERLRASLDALLENAVKYSEPGAAIELRARRLGRGTVLIEVEDEGCGVPAEALERIFERFARADTARTRSAGGVGLGLAIVDAIAKGHGGACTARSTGNGSIFALRLPNFAPAGLQVRQPDPFAGTAGWGPPEPAPSEPPLI
jgi:signal transduction histidine kinase